MDRQLPHPLGQGRIPTGNGAAITGAAEIFSGEKAEAPGITPATHRTTRPAGTSGLGAIFHHQQPMALGDRT